MRPRDIPPNGAVVPALTFGIEEEFALLDAHTLSTVDAGPRAVAQLSRQHPGHVTHEFYSSQIEYSSPVFADMAQALAALTQFRADLGAWALDHHVIAVGTGTPYRTTVASQVHDEARYQRIGRDIAGLTAEHQINGMHVHVGVGSREEGVRASDALRPWLPVLLALSTNSPYWQGHDTGWASWRALHSRRWTTYGIPPRFETVDAYNRTVAALEGIGVTSDRGTVNWSVRLSAAHPTVETRVCDAQLDARSTVALAALIRALVCGADRTLTPVEPAPGIWDAALWHAGRYGLASELVEPRTGRLAPAQIAVESLRGHVSGALHALGDDRIVDAFLHRVLREGTGSRVQRRSARHGERALAELYRRSIAGDLAGAPRAGKALSFDDGEP